MSLAKNVVSAPQAHARFRRQGEHRGEQVLGLFQRVDRPADAAELRIAQDAAFDEKQVLQFQGVHGYAARLFLSPAPGEVCRYSLKSL
jgi:hypothetical protein